MHRRQFLSLAGAVSAGALAGCTIQKETESAQTGGGRIALEPVVEGLHFPTDMAFLPTGDHLVVERFGLVVRVTEDGPAEQPFLSVRDRMAEIEGERGLLGLALHPEFDSNRRFYVRYSAPRREGMDDHHSHTAVLSEFRAAEDLSTAVPDSERILLEVPEPGPNHNAGDLAFGPDGYLYASLGDGQRENIGGENGSWWYEQGQTAQNTRDNLLGSVLRLDVDDTGGDREYAIPSDNPLVGREGRDEYYAWGFRNPYRLSFDDGRLFVGDVGTHTRESVYLAEKGGNHGWPITEGSVCASTIPIGHAVSDNPLNAFNPKTWVSEFNRISPYKVCPTTDGTRGSLVEPVVEYQRPNSRAITGGFVYRGERVPELQGKYVFGDYMIPAPIFVTEEPTDSSRPWPFEELVVAGTESGRLQDGLVSFARDPQGELYVLTTQFSEGTGRVRKLVSAA